jgi:transcription elongation GreA/GreB family factor
MNNLKPFVNDKALWDSFLEEVDRRIVEVHRVMEQSSRAEELFRLQGQAFALRKIKQLRDQVNGG